MVSLSVNLNKVALLRNARQLDIPNPVRAAVLALEGGADGITVHPRPDERHIRPSDVHDLVALLNSWPAVELNIEGNPLHQLMDHVRAVRPDQCTFVPDDVGAATSDHGWDLRQDGARLRPLIDEARSLGCRVSLFVEADARQMELARQLGADRIELYTEPYARAFAAGEPTAASLRRYQDAARAALQAGLGINAGHDLNRANLAPFLSAVPGVLEVSIGHALIADALEFGLARTVGLYLAEIRRAESSQRELQ
jgi:pyridoxine 5-phosphate synthase